MMEESGEQDAPLSFVSSFGEVWLVDDREGSSAFQDQVSIQRAVGA